MSEEAEIAESGGPSIGSGPAVALALAGASRAKADTFLDEQTHLARLQAKELSHELDLRHWSLWVRHLSGMLKLTLEIGLAVVVLGLASFVAAGVWNAAHSDGLVIESFSVPPDLAARGLTGQVVAGEILDRLAEMNRATVSARSSKSYAASWGDDIKVEIPDTGISVAEAYRFLRRWLGHESHISGAVWRGQAGIVMTARSEGRSITVTGPEADLDSQIRKTAEAVFGLAEPYRYGVYLIGHDRAAEGQAVYRQLIASGSATDRAWGLVGLARALATQGDLSPREVERMIREAMLLDPGNSTAVNNFGVSERALSHLEAGAIAARKAEDMLGGDDPEIGTVGLPVLREMAANVAHIQMGAYGDAIPSLADIIRSGNAGSYAGLSNMLAEAEIGAHDLKAARAVTLDPDREHASADYVALVRIRISTLLALAGENWSAAVAALRASDPIRQRHPSLQDRFLVEGIPLQANAEARLGHFAAAEALIAATPADCDACLLARAHIAELRGQHARADWWFARAVQDAPSIPLVYATWGEALLRRGDADGAIAQFKTANKKGPHFADPLEGWGEALMAKNQSHLALAKFAEANKYAPNWGRLHLKWGEALVFAGKPDAAKSEFARAAALDLTPSEKFELAKVVHV